MSLPGRNHAARKLPPSPPLLGPRGLASELVQVALGEGLDAIDGLKVQVLFLNVRSQQGQVEHIRQPAAGEAEPGGECGLVGVLAAVELALQVVGEGEHPRDARGLALLGGLGRRRDDAGDGLATMWAGAGERSLGRCWAWSSGSGSGSCWSSCSS